MARSIVAVWCLALALIVIAATAGCDLGGCANGDDCSAGLTPWMPDMAQAAQVCSTACPACGAGETCYHPSAAARLPAFCAKQCVDDRDCAAGQMCATLASTGVPNVCIAAGAPMSCVAGYTCSTAGTHCQDASTLATPFSDDADGVCGWALSHCANGCSDGACG